MPLTIPVILAIVQAAIAGAPDAIKAAEAMKAFIGQLFASKVISAADQNTLMAAVDSTCADVLAGNLPAWWTVEANPA